MTDFVTADLPPYECADPPLEEIWRATVGAEDVVHVIVGDRADTVPPHIDVLPGRKRLVTGTVVLNGGFVLSPLPLDPRQLAPGQINLHGRSPRPVAPSPDRLCVSLDRNGFRPVRLADARRLARLVPPVGLGSFSPAVAPLVASLRSLDQAAE